jgi:hypothetical protein
MIRAAYKRSDFDFALVYIGKLDLFYIFPVNVFINYGSEIHLVETNKRQRKPRSAQYREAWELILQASVGEEIGKEKYVCSPVQDGEMEF